MFTLAFNIQPVRAEPKTWYVDDDGPADFSKIQDAINAASPGDTIYVYNGTYYERILIYQSLLLVGENKYGTIIDAGYGDAVSTHYTRDVKLTGFTIRNAETCIHLYYGSNNTIVDNIISDNILGDPFNWGGGISLDNSNNNTIADNIISNITEVGIYHGSSSYNMEVRNVIIQNDSLGLQTTNGIHLGDGSHDNAILNNTISKSLVGIYAGQLAYNNTIAGNTIENLTSYECGINIWGPNNTIINNTITGMSYVGIQLNSYSSDGLYGTPNACADNIVIGNVISNCTFGINLILAAFSNTIVENNVSSNGMGILLSDSSNNNTVLENFVSNNDYGLLLFSSNDTRVEHNNFISNTQQLLLSDSFNTAWDDGYPSGGNYWSDYNGTDLYSGPYQNETGDDGIGDTPYVIDDSNVDHYPLVNPFVIPPTTLIGDLNLDGEVSLADLQLLANAYNSHPGDPNWNLLADIAPPYEIISLTDLVTMAMHYGQHNP
jgi:parallel beta-helix repeat protein